MFQLITNPNPDISNIRPITVLYEYKWIMNKQLYHYLPVYKQYSLLFIDISSVYQRSATALLHSLSKN